MNKDIMMSKYRIVKETKEITKEFQYFIEKKNKLLWWSWWSRVTRYNILYDYSYCVSYESFCAAKTALDRLTQKTIKEVVK